MPAESDGVAPFEKEGVRGFLHSPSAVAQRGLVLTHGAGANCTAPLLVAVANIFVAHGLAVLRCDLPFRQKRRRGPPHPVEAAADRFGLRAATGALREIVEGDVFLGGHSYGGRQASMLAAEESDLVSGLLLLSYPLHPPGKPDQLRTEHLPRLRTPSLFVHGTNDPFGSLGAIEQAIALIPVSTKLIAIKGASHDLKGGRFDLNVIAAAFLNSGWVKSVLP